MMVDSPAGMRLAAATVDTTKDQRDDMIPDTTKDKRDFVLPGCIEPDSPGDRVSTESSASDTLGALERAGSSATFIKQSRGLMPTDGVRRIYVAFRIVQIADISIPGQTFRCRFDLYCEWLDKTMSRASADNLALPESDHFEPTIRYTNADEFEEGRKVYVTFPTSGFVGFRVTVTGIFRTSLDLTAFPFDTQPLTIEVTLGIDRSSKALLHHAVAQFRDAENHANVLMRQSVPEYTFRPLRYHIS